MVVIVPNELRDRINARLALALRDWPDATERDRDVLFHEVLDYWNQYGVLPEFDVVNVLRA